MENERNERKEDDHYAEDIRHEYRVCFWSFTVSVLLLMLVGALDANNATLSWQYYASRVAWMVMGGAFATAIMAVKTVRWIQHIQLASEAQKAERRIREKVVENLVK